MPFSVQPSKSVVISGESITKDDFLKVILEDGHVLYVRADHDMDDPYFANYTFDQEFLPKALVVGIADIVDDWYKRSYLPYEQVRVRVHQKHSELFRKKGGLRGQLRATLSSTFYVSKGREGGFGLDIGDNVHVRAYCLEEDAEIFDAHGSREYQNHYWTFPSPIAAILQTTRAAIRQERAD
jgi:hypothetical protein